MTEEERELLKVRDEDLRTYLPLIASDRERVKDAANRLLEFSPHRIRDITAFKGYFGIDGPPKRLDEIEAQLKTSLENVESLIYEVIGLLNHPSWAEDRSKWVKGDEL